MMVFAGIDGTGEWSDESYAQSFARSHVNRLHRLWPYPRLSFYHRGPSLLGIETAMYAERAYDFIRGALRRGEAQGVFLAGYSRGGAGVVEVAKWLGRWWRDIPVDGLFLFDAVDRSTEVGGIFPAIIDTPIVDSVKYCAHALRDPLSESRESFGNCGRDVENRSSTEYIEKKFNCTHGGLGGVPWDGPRGVPIDEGFPDGVTRITPEQDRAGAGRVWNWMFPKVLEAIRRCRVRIAATP